MLEDNLRINVIQLLTQAFKFELFEVQVQVKIKIQNSRLGMVRWWSGGQVKFRYSLGKVMVQFMLSIGLV